MLPRSPALFLGRQGVLTTLQNWLKRDPLVILKGLKGIGKTSLALHLLQAESNHRPTYYVGFQEQAGLRPLFDALSREPECVDVAAQAKEWIRLVSPAGDRADNPFWVLDDLSHLDPAERLVLIRVLHTYLRFPVLVISQEELPLSPLEQVDINQLKLEGLDDTSSCELLRELLSGHNSQIDEAVVAKVARQTGGHPLLLKLSAALFQSGGAVPAGQILLNELLAGLDAELQTLLKTLCLCRVRMPEAGLAALPGGERVEELATRFLAERNEQGWFIPRYVADQMDSDGQEALHSQLTTVFRNLGFQNEAVFHGLRSQRGADVAKMLESQARVMCARGQYELLHETIAQLENLGLPIPPSAIIAQSNALANQGRWDECLKRLGPLMECPEWELPAYLSWAAALLNRGEWSKALEHYGRILEARDAPLNLTHKAVHYSALLMAFSGRTEQGRQVLNERETDPNSFHRVRVEAVVSHFEGRATDSLELARRAVVLSRREGGVRPIALSLQAEAEALCDLGRADAARPICEEALDFARRSGEALIIGICLLTTARIARAEGLELEATARLLDAELQFLTLGNRNYAAIARAELLDLQAAHGELDEKAWARCMETATLTGNLRLERTLQEVASRFRSRQEVSGLQSASAKSPKGTPPKEEISAKKSIVPALSACLMGEFELAMGQIRIREADWPTRKSAALMALLCHHGDRGVADERLLGLFWPDSSQEQARSSLRSALYQIRKTLKAFGESWVGEAVSRSRKTGLVKLSQPIPTDVDAFNTCLSEGKEAYLAQRYQDAITLLNNGMQLCRGEFLENFREEWTDLPRHFQNKAYLDLCLVLSQSELANKRGHEAESAARCGLTSDPCGELLHLALMEALLLQGKRAEALRHYKKALAQIEQELGHSPRCFDAIFPRLVL